MKKRLMKNIESKFKRLEKEHSNISKILIGIAIVLFWRGTWILCDLYLFPNNPPLSGLISIFIALLILYLMNFDLKELI